MIIIIGIDPGSIRTGYGILTFNKKTINYLQSGIIKTNLNLEFLDRLQIIYLKLKKIIKYYVPNIIAIEKIFVYKQFNAAIKLGITSGVIFSIIINNTNLTIFEYSNLQIKKIIQKFDSTKKDIGQQIKHLLNINLFLEIDTTDALSVAFTHCYFYNDYLTNKILLQFGLVIFNSLIIIYINICIYRNIGNKSISLMLF